jgi:UDP-galactopyranose mutase
MASVATAGRLALGAVPAPRAVIVGAGLTGCTVAHRLADLGMRSLLLEEAEVPGGLIRSAHLEGVLYEPHGSHIFHTEDGEVWELANRFARFNHYRHRVDIMVEGRIRNWPILLSDIEDQPDADEIKLQLEERREVDSAARAEAANFEDWCLELMGPILYERYVKPYTQKQWGRPPSELSASWAPRRVGVRWDNDPYLFPDVHQGWPGTPNGYTDLIEGLLDRPEIECRTGTRVDLGGIASHAEERNPVVVTAALDSFSGERLGRLEWRGVLVRPVHLPQVEHAQGAMVVNYPGLEYPFIRIHETKHASGQECEGTVLGIEFTGAPGRHYPVESERNRELNDRYQEEVRGQIGTGRTFFAGRLATYKYLDMDDCMRQAFDCAEAVAATLS